MKIGTITFHWVTNYGAVLQAYALQKYLKSRGHDVSIINYKPHTYVKPLYRCFITKHPSMIVKNVIDYFKESKFRVFRQKYLNVSKPYHSLAELKASPPPYDVYICGSDQIWNPTFTSKGEKKPTSTYFLDFGGENVSRLAYAASFGCVEYPEGILQDVVPALNRFKSIGVRENTGLKILEKVGITNNVSLVPDPTLLLSANDYLQLLPSQDGVSGKRVFFYILHTGQELIKKITSLTEKHGYSAVDSSSWSNSLMSIEDWLSNIRNSNVVITNSFHGVVFAIIFHKPFIVVPVEGARSGMNDRIHTLLGKFEMHDRLLDRYDEKKVSDLLRDNIDWNEIDRKRENFAKDADVFFSANSI